MSARGARKVPARGAAARGQGGKRDPSAAGAGRGAGAFLLAQEGDELDHKDVAGDKRVFARLAQHDVLHAHRVDDTGMRHDAARTHLKVDFHGAADIGGEQLLERAAVRRLVKVKPGVGFYVAIGHGRISLHLLRYCIICRYFRPGHP